MSSFTVPKSSVIVADLPVGTYGSFTVNGDGSITYSTTVPAASLPAATTAAAGAVKAAVLQANSTASDVAGIVADFNTLLGKLKTSGAMASS